MRASSSEILRLRSRQATQTQAIGPLLRRRRADWRPRTPREALEVVKRYWRAAPVDVYAAAGELGLGPVEDPSLPDELCGLIERLAPDDWQIVVNRNHPLTLRRFTVAHEIGHYIYHRLKLETAGGTSDTIEFQTDPALCPNPEIGPEEEWQANTFAIKFLIPDHVLRTAQSIGLNDDAELARGFNVWRAAMRIKLGLPALEPAFKGQEFAPPPA